MMQSPLLSRRAFLGSAALLGGGVLLSGCMGTGAGPATGAVKTGTRSLDKMGLQLYTIRDIFKADPLGTLKKMADIGYSYIEYADMPDLPIKHGDFRKAAEDVGLTVPSGIYDNKEWFTDTQKIIDRAGALGNKYVVNSWIDQTQRTLTEIMKQAEAFNKVGEIAKRAGMHYLYHNHEFEFANLDGDDTMFDVLAKNTDPQFANFELDMGWAYKGKADNVEIMKKYPGRIKTSHIKDFTADGKMVDVGDGAIDWANILAHADIGGIEYHFVEHDDPIAPADRAVAKSYNYVKALRF
jgi:sugar phosphate isomerase/epimerase